MSNKENSKGKEIKLTWVSGPNTKWTFNNYDPVAQEKALLDALWDDLNARCAEKEIEAELQSSNFAEANEVISRIKQQIKDSK
jgi:hypothetical protein